MRDDLHAIEFESVRKWLEQLAVTPYGKEAARELAPAPEIRLAKTMQTSVSTARQLLEQNRQPTLEQLPNIRAALKQSQQKGAMLTPQALHNILTTLECAKTLLSTLATTPKLYPENEALPVLPAGLMQLLTKQLARPNGLSPQASEAYEQCLSQRQALRVRAEEGLRDVIASVPSMRWGKDILAWSGERICAALKSEYVPQVQGVRRGVLQLKRLELVEPMSLVTINNALEKNAAELDKEQQRILREITQQVSAVVAEIETCVALITWVDLAFAGAHLSVNMNAHAPTLVEEPVLELNEAYHPVLLLQFQHKQIPQPVPLTLKFSPDKPVLIITGPNTGGKTVALKTVGLLTAMALSGLHIPAERNCIVGGYRRILVDLGDRQSLFHHLSTFAGHVESMKRILDLADEHSLVLLDELGTGTDPEDGAAIANAFIDELLERKCCAVINTHLPSVKRSATTKPAIQVAAMSFDLGKLAPTYKIVLGVVGESYGIAVAERCGLDRKLIEKARKYIQEIKRE